MANNQIKLLIEALKERPQTMLMVGKRINVERANICRYISELSKSKRIALVKKSVCEITRHPAGYYTSDPQLFPKDNQMSIFL
jgi:hypothetical protein